MTTGVVAHTPFGVGRRSTCRRIVGQRPLVVIPCQATVSQWSGSAQKPLVRSSKGVEACWRRLLGECPPAERELEMWKAGRDQRDRPFCSNDARSHIGYGASSAVACPRPHDLRMGDDRLFAAFERLVWAFRLHLWPHWLRRVLLSIVRGECVCLNMWSCPDRVAQNTWGRGVEPPKSAATHATFFQRRLHQRKAYWSFSSMIPPPAVQGRTHDLSLPRIQRYSHPQDDALRRLAKSEEPLATSFPQQALLSCWEPLEPAFPS
jgi:hypothetical protein